MSRTNQQDKEVPLTQLIKKPARNAHLFLSKRWGLHMKDCSRVLELKLTVQITSEHLVRPLIKALRYDADEAQKYWGFHEVKQAFAQIGITWDGSPQNITGYDIRQWVRKLKNSKVNSQFQF
jgi:hypothetical protein